MAILRWKQIAKQYGVLWFAWYWGTFFPLFAVFTIPYHCGFDLVGLGDYLERHGWLEWLKWFNINIRNLIDRCNNKDTFVIFDSVMDGNYVSAFFIKSRKSHPLLNAFETLCRLLTFLELDSNLLRKVFFISDKFLELFFLENVDR